MLESIKQKLLTGNELLVFFWKMKMWWMIPLIVVLMMMAVIIIFAHSSPIAPFLYAVI